MNEKLPLLDPFVLVSVYISVITIDQYLYYILRCSSQCRHKIQPVWDRGCWQSQDHQLCLSSPRTSSLHLLTWLEEGSKSRKPWPTLSSLYSWYLSPAVRWHWVNVSTELDPIPARSGMFRAEDNWLRHNAPLWWQVTC